MDGDTGSIARPPIRLSSLGGPPGDDSLIGGLAIDPVSPSNLYAGTNAGVFRSADAGGSWKGVGPFDSPPVHSVALDPSDPRIILAGTDEGLFKSTDGGSSWSGKLLAASIYNILFSPQKPSVVYGADYDNAPYYPEPSHVYASADGGANWTRSESLTDIPPGALAIDPKDPSTLYSGGVMRHSAILQGLFKSADSGLTWTREDGRDVTAVLIDPRNPSTFYAVTQGAGFIWSADGGRSWNGLNTGWTFPPASVTALAIDQTGTRLHAGTEDGQVFSYRISSGGVEISSGAVDLSAGTEGRTNVLFAGDNRAASRSFDASGKSTANGPYGPFAGWFARAEANGSDGLTRVLWNHQDGSAALWLLGPTGNQASYRFGPAAGWTAVDVSVGGDGTTHLLWTNADGRAELTSVAITGERVGDATFGPFGGWTAVSVSDGKDGLTRLLWNNTDGRAGLSLIDAGRIVATYRFAPGAGWAARDVTVSADNQARILFAGAGGLMALWSVANSGAVTDSGTVYGPPRPGEAAVRVSAGADGLTRVLWTSPAGAGDLWLMGPDNAFRSSFAFCGDFGQDSGCGDWDY